MVVEKIYRYVELWNSPQTGHPVGMFQFREKKNVYSSAVAILVEISHFAENGKVTQKKMLEMLYPGYPWDTIVKLYNEAPRGQK